LDFLPQFLLRFLNPRLIEWNVNVCVCVYMCMYVCTCVCMYRYVCVYVHTYDCQRPAVLTDRLQNQEAAGLQQRLTVCLLSATERSVSNVARRILIRTYKVKTSNKTFPSFISRNSWHPIAEPWGSTEPDLRTSGTVC